MLLILIPSEFLLYLGVLGRLGANANQFQIYPDEFVSLSLQAKHSANPAKDVNQGCRLALAVFSLPYSDPCRWVGVVLWLREYEEVPSAWIGMQQVL